MHEIGIATSIVDVCAANAAGARVLRVRVEIGQLTAVLPDALRFCFDVCARGTPVEGATLDIDEMPGQAVCDSCRRNVTLSIPFGRCACGEALRITGGLELRVKDMEIA